jgi:hypothetical protein
MSENKTAKTPTDGGTGFIDGVWHGPGSTAWQCQCGKAYTVTCISSKPSKRDLTCVCGAVWEGETMVHPPREREWVGLTDEETDELSRSMVKGDKSVNWLCRAIEAKLKEKNHG